MARLCLKNKNIKPRRGRRWLRIHTALASISLEFGSSHPSWALPTTGNSSPWGPNALSMPPWASALSNAYLQQRHRISNKQKTFKRSFRFQNLCIFYYGMEKDPPHGPMNAVSRVNHMYALAITLRHLHISTNMVSGGSWPQLFNGTSPDFRVNITHKAMTSHSLSGTLGP